MNRDAMGANAFDERPARRRDLGALVFDGAMLELEPKVRARGEEAVERDVNAALRRSGFVRYCVKIKRNFGCQDDTVALIDDARAALEKALVLYPEVKAAVERVQEECEMHDYEIENVEDEYDNEYSSDESSSF